MITAAGSEPGPGGVGPGAVIRAGCADRGGGGQSKDGMGLGNGGSGTRSGLAVSSAKELMCLSGKFPGRGCHAQVQSLLLHVSRPPGSGRDTTRGPGDVPTVASLPWRQSQAPASPGPAWPDDGT